MKNIIQWNLVPSLLVVGGCLALSQVAQAEPAFHGTVTIRVEGDITSWTPMDMGGMGGMGGMEKSGGPLGEANMLTIPAKGGVVGPSTGDVAALRLRRGDPVAFSATTLMPPMSMGMMGEMPGTSEMFTFAADSGLSVTSDGVTFSSTGPEELEVEAMVTVVDASKPDYGTATGELYGYFISNDEGVISGWFTIDVPVAPHSRADKEVKK